jgi:hypothetical protein
MRFRVKRYWEMCDEVDVDAASAEAALEVAHALPLSDTAAQYVSDSLTSDPETDVQLIPAQRRNKEYKGCREGYAVIVTVDGRRLKPRYDLWNHSPTGFEWGYGGSGPAQLALAILADHCNGDQRAFDLHHRFKWAVIAKLPKARWVLTSDEIDQTLRAIENAELFGRALSPVP